MSKEKKIRQQLVEVISMGQAIDKESNLIRRFSLNPKLESAVNAEIERQKKRYKPDSLDELVGKSKFDRREIQLLYRGFKEACPNGIVTKEKFLLIFDQFYPYGDPHPYAALVFESFDEDGNGEISFDEFVSALSILSRGTFEEKSNWIFSLYDSGCKGYVTREDLQRVVSAMYDIIGSNSFPPVTATTSVHHANELFAKLDENGDGKINFDEFLERCKKDEIIMKSMEVFSTVYSKTDWL